MAVAFPDIISVSWNGNQVDVAGILVIGRQHNGIRQSGIDSQQEYVDPVRVGEGLEEGTVFVHQGREIFLQIDFAFLEYRIVLDTVPPGKDRCEYAGK